MKTSAQSEGDDQNQWENVDLIRVRFFVVDYLGRDPTFGTQWPFNGVTAIVLRLCASQMALIFFNDATHSEIGQFHHRKILIIDDEENDARFQVAVNDAIGVQIVKSHDDLVND